MLRAASKLGKRLLRLNDPLPSDMCSSESVEKGFLKNIFFY